MKRSGPLKRKNPLAPGKPLGYGKKRKPLKARSPKRQAEYDQYNPRREQFLKENPVCQITGCDRPSVDVHHMQKRNGARLLHESKWLATCRECNGRAEDDPKWAFEHGYKLHVNRKSPATRQPPKKKPSLEPDQTPSAQAGLPTSPDGAATAQNTPELASG